MDCTMIQPGLVPFHFGTSEAGEREHLERHLMECASCLRDYLAIKRSIELGANDEDARARPSPIAKQRLRKAIAAELAPKRTVVRSRWERNIRQESIEDARPTGKYTTFQVTG